MLNSELTLFFMPNLTNKSAKGFSEKYDFNTYVKLAYCIYSSKFYLYSHYNTIEQNNYERGKSSDGTKKSHKLYYLTAAPMKTLNLLKLITENI